MQDHVTALVRPAAICIDPNHIELGGQLVTPHLQSVFPPGDTFETKQPHVFDPSITSNPQLATITNGQQAVEACLPPGRYGINVVYPTGQAWTTPNEAGRCAAAEGETIVTSDPGTCSVQSRPVLYSQGTRAVVEIVNDPHYCVGTHAVPAACTSVSP